MYTSFFYQTLKTGKSCRIVVFIPIATSSLINDEFNTDPIVGGNPGTLQTCFANCMETAENIITDDLEGWIAWNYSPFVQIAVAIDCAWNCP